MSLTEYTETGYLLSWNNGLATQWFDTDEQAQNGAKTFGLTEYAITTYQAVGHTVYGASLT